MPGDAGRFIVGVNKALEYLIKNEIVYHTSEGYIVYNRFFAIWLSSLVW